MHEFEPRSAVSRPKEHCAWLSPWRYERHLQGRRIGPPSSAIAGKRVCQANVIQVSKQADCKQTLASRRRLL